MLYKPHNTFEKQRGRRAHEGGTIDLASSFGHPRPHSIVFRTLPRYPHGSPWTLSRSVAGSLSIPRGMGVQSTDWLPFRAVQHPFPRLVPASLSTEGPRESIWDPLGISHSNTLNHIKECVFTCNKKIEYTNLTSRTKDSSRGMCVALVTKRTVPQSSPDPPTHRVCV